MTILLAFLSFDKSLFLVFLISELNSDLSNNKKLPFGPNGLNLILVLLRSWAAAAKEADALLTLRH